MIVVTGSDGFIGSNLVNTLASLGENVLCVDFVTRNYLTPTKNISRIIAEHFYDDLKSFHKRFKFDTIFHEGAISSTTETDKNKLLQYNIDPSLKLIYFCRDNNIKLQYASSASVYGNLDIKQWDDESKPLNPLNEYAKTKKTIDYVSDSTINSKNEPLLLQGMRYFNVYGSNEDHKKDQASPYFKFKKQFSETGKIKLFEGSKEFYRDFVSVEHIIEKKLYCLGNKPSGIYDVGTGNPKSFYDVAIEICDSEDYIEWVPMPDNLKEHYQKYTKANMGWLS